MNKSGIHRKKRDHRYSFAFFSWPTCKNMLELTTITNEIERWCEKNLRDDFTCADAGIHIYEEIDAVAFKMRWM